MQAITTQISDTTDAQFITRLIAEAADSKLRDGAIEYIQGIVGLAIRMNPYALATFYKSAEDIIEMAELAALAQSEANYNA